MNARIAHLAKSNKRRPQFYIVTIVCGVVFFLLALPAGLLALAQGLGILPLPYQLFLVLQRLPILFPLHMIASGLALMLIPIAAFTRHRLKVHRVTGRVAIVCVITGGLTALFVAHASEASFAARAGFFVQGLAWLTLVTAAVAAIRATDRALHARLMIAMGCVASGALWLRLVMAGAAAFQLPFELVYAFAAWASWSIPLAIALLAAPGSIPSSNHKNVPHDTAPPAIPILSQ